MYWIEYKGEKLKPLSWLGVDGNGNRHTKVQNTQCKRFKNILILLKQLLHFGWDEEDIKVFHNTRLVAEVIPYQHPRHEEYYRVKFHTNHRETKELVKLIKQGYNVNSAAQYIYYSYPDRCHERSLEV